ncbi:MAG: mycothiol system anti-sigma-R factor [Longimicrobiales bacterium]|jgi:anti-sigma factor (TIGR02949 family)|nr:mycothiol system anti-sigma-R factor [Longimicrobiales bacterium]
MAMFDRLRGLFGQSTVDGSDDAGGAMMSCEEALRLVHEFLDGELEDSSADEVQQHFHMCQRCYPHLKLETAFREAVRRAASGQSAPLELRDRVTALLEEARMEG